MPPFTSESIPDMEEVRENLLQRLDRHRGAILLAVGVAVVGSLGLLAWSSVNRDRQDKLRTEYHSIVDDFASGRTLYTLQSGEPLPQKEVAEEQARRLEELRERARGADVEPLILLQLALRYQVAGQDDRTLVVLADLKERFPTDPVLQIQAYDSDRASLVSRLEAISRRRQQFQGERKTVVPKPDLSTVALVETDLGSFKVVFYPDLAPLHVGAFVDLARAGGFNGTRLYYVRRGEYIELGGGDRTRNDDPRDDRDDDPRLALPPENDSRLFVKHRRRTVTSVQLLSGDQKDRFAVVLAEAQPEFDSIRTPFGELLDDESAAIADRLGNAMTYSQDAAMVGRREEKDYPNTPSRPVVVRRISIWKEGVLAEGHAWDTARVNTDQPEPTSTRDE